MRGTSKSLTQFGSRILGGPWWQRLAALGGLLAVASILIFALREHHPLQLIGVPLYYLSELAWTAPIAKALDGLFGFAFETLPLTEWWVVGGLAVFWQFSERVRFEDRGVRIYFLWPGLSLAFIRWDRVRKITLIEHTRSAPTLLVQYDTWIGLPWRLGVHARRYERGSDLVRLIASQAATQGIPVRKVTISSVFLWSGWVLILAGLLYFWMITWSITQGIERYTALDDAYRGYPPLPSPISIASLYFISVACISAGFGFLSVYHRGSPRTGLFLLWMMAIIGQAPVAIYALVWLAIVAIWHAAPTPFPYLEMHETIPAWTLVVPLYADLLVLLIAPIAYYGACYWAFSGNRVRDVVGAKRRRLPAKGERHDEATAPTALQA